MTDGNMKGAIAMMPAKDMATAVVKAMDSKKGLDIRLLHTADITVLAEYFVICTASSATHVKTLTEEIDRVMSELGEPPLRREGYRSGSWVLLDFGCVIVHVFMDEARKFYDLERLWHDAETVDLSGILQQEPQN